MQKVAINVLVWGVLVPAAGWATRKLLTQAEAKLAPVKK